MNASHKFFELGIIDGSPYESYIQKGKRHGSSYTKKEFSLDRMMHAQSILDFDINEFVFMLGCFGPEVLKPSTIFRW